MQRLLDNNNIYTLLRRVLSSGSKDFLLNLVCATSGMHDTEDGWEQGRAFREMALHGMSALHTLQHQSRRSVHGCAQAVTGLSLSSELHRGRATRCWSWLWHPFTSLCVTQLPWSPPQRRGQQWKAREINYKTPKQSTKPWNKHHGQGKTLLCSVVGRNLQRQQKGQRKRFIFGSRKRTEHSVMNWREGLSGKISCQVKITIKTVAQGHFLCFSNVY